MSQPCLRGFNWRQSLISYTRIQCYRIYCTSYAQLRRGNEYTEGQARNCAIIGISLKNVSDNEEENVPDPIFCYIEWN